MSVHMVQRIVYMPLLIHCLKAPLLHTGCWVCLHSVLISAATCHTSTLTHVPAHACTQQNVFLANQTVQHALKPHPSSLSIGKSGR